MLDISVKTGFDEVFYYTTKLFLVRGSLAA